MLFFFWTRAFYVAGVKLNDSLAIAGFHCHAIKKKKKNRSRSVKEADNNNVLKDYEINISKSQIWTTYRCWVIC